MNIYHSNLYNLLALPILILCFAIAPLSLWGHGGPDHPPTNFIFEENKGQWEDFILHRAQMGSKTLFLEKQGLTWNLKHEEDLKNYHKCKPHGSCNQEEAESHSLRQHAFHVRFLGGQAPSKVTSTDTSSYYKNYLLGNDSAAWASDVRNFKRVKLENVYPGIHYQIYSNNENLKYDFLLEAGKSPESIQMSYTDVDTLFTKEGRLYICTSVDTLVEERPVAFQRIRGHKTYLECDFKVTGNTVTFSLKDYNKNFPITIDPEIVFSTYTGSTSDNWGMTATPGANEEMYAAGVVFDEGYPTTSGAYQTFYAVGNEEMETDVAITKFSADGTQLIYSTYLGGRASEVPHSIIENKAGELVVFGTTSSLDFPVSTNGFQRRHEGGAPLLGNNPVNGIPYASGSDIYVTVLSSNGSSLVGSSLLGGTGNDGLNIGTAQELAVNYGDQLRGEVILDNANNIYVASMTLSDDFPTTSNAYQRNNNGGQDGVLFSFNNDCSDLRFSTYFGGGRSEAGYALKRRSDGSIYVVGGTTSSNYPTTNNAVTGTFQGGAADGFVTHFNNNASAILNSTYIGTPGYDQVYLCALSFDDELYITGQSDQGFPISSGVYGTPNSGQFIQRMSPDLSSVELSTEFGTGSGEVDLSPTAFMIDTCKRIFYSGWGGVTNNLGGQLSNSTTDGLDITSDAFQSNTDGSDFYFMVLERDFEELIYGSFFGRIDNVSQTNDHVDGGTSRFDDKGIIYQAVCAGCGGFDDFPTTPRAWSRRNGTSSRCNLAAIKFDFQLSRLEAIVDLELDTFGCAPYEAQFINNSIGADEYFWDFGDGDTSTAFAPTNTYDSIGTYDVTFIARSNSSCLDPDTLEITIETILAEAPKKDTLLVCGEPFIDLSSSRDGKNPVYRWNTGSQSQTLRAFSSGVYSVTATESNCVFIDSFDLTLINPSVRLEDRILCGEDEYVLRLDDRAENIQWRPTNETSTQITVTENDLYIAEYSIDECDFIDSAGIGFATIPEIEIIGLDTACEGETVVLDVQNNSGATIETTNWSTGATSQSIGVSETGTYAVEVVSDSSCVAEDEKFVYIIPSIPDLSLPDTLLCKDSEYAVDLSSYEDDAQIIWNDGAMDPQRNFTESGNYSVQISNQCDLIDASFTLEFSAFNADDRPFHIPNVFSPNGDGINDIFKVEKAREMEIRDFDMKVFDRWGNMVFESRDHEFGWDGRFKSPPMNPAVFAYVIRMEYFLCETPQKIKENGDISIVK